jgi:glycosyltransferase involved in cell wall biosynthesis
MSSTRPFVLVLAPHHPQRDPRITWLCGALESMARVFVVGVVFRRERGGDIPFPSSAVDPGLTGLRAAGRFVAGALSSSASAPRARAWPVVAAVAAAAPAVGALRVEAAVAARVMRALGLEGEPDDDGSRGSRLARSMAEVSALSRTAGTLSSWGRVAEACLAASLDHERPACVVCNDLDTLPAGIALKRLYGCRLVYDAHEFKAHEKPWYTASERTTWTRVEASLARHADLAFTVSPPLADEMTRQLQRPFLALPNCEPASAPILDDDAVVPGAGPVRFLFQGRFSADRGLEPVVRAFASLGAAEARLDLRGPDGAERQRLMRLAADLGSLDTTTFFPPPVDEAELITAMYGYDVGLIPYAPVSLNNELCCPNKLSQYMRAGMAVVTNDLPYVRSVVSRFDCGDSYGPDRPLEELLHRLVRDRPRILEMRRHALTAARTSFHFERMGSACIDEIRALLAG